MIICSGPLSIGRATREPGKAGAILRERMRLSQLSFRRGIAYDYRPRVWNRSRRVLPIVAVSRVGERVQAVRPLPVRLDALPVWRRSSPGVPVEWLASPGRKPGAHTAGGRCVWGSHARPTDGRCSKCGAVALFRP